MSYLQFTFETNEPETQNEILTAFLSQLPFESFQEENEQILAYILESDYDKVELESVLSSLPEGLLKGYESKSIPKENWNKKWEENFKPTYIESFCQIRAPFHEEMVGYEYNIVIEPKMSFGTGHHATTQLMVENMKEIDIQGKSVLDVGSGTGILAILAKMLEAKAVKAVDNEEWAYENMKENFQKNGVEVEPVLGTISDVKAEEKYDIVLANINKNVLLNQLSAYRQCSTEKAILLLSGFFTMDNDELIAAAKENGYAFISASERENWSCLKFQLASL